MVNLRLICAWLVLLRASPAYASLIDAVQCLWSARRVIPLALNYRDYSNYDKYFRDDSVLSFAQAGDYVGPDDIAEYIQIVDSEYNPFIASGVDLWWPSIRFLDYNLENDECIFRLLFVVRYTSEPDYTLEDVSGKTTVMFKFFLDRETGFPRRTNAYFPENFVSQTWDVLQNTDSSRDVVCSVANGICADQLGTNANCASDLAALDTTEGELHYIDGNSQGCRMLHAVFAMYNPEDHCAHISLTPREDPKGRTKCYESAGVVPLDLFQEKDISAFNSYSRWFGVDPDVGFAYY